MRDHKTGYHWIWLTPILFVLLAASAGVHKLCELMDRVRSRYVEWQHPEIKRLKQVSGQNK